LVEAEASSTADDTPDIAIDDTDYPALPVSHLKRTHRAAIQRRTAAERSFPKGQRMIPASPASDPSALAENNARQIRTWRASKDNDPLPVDEG